MSRIVFIQPESWLEDVLASPAQTRFLRLLARQPDKYWTGREAAIAVGMPQTTASAIVRRLDELHLLDLRRVGPSYLFRLRQDIALAARLKQVFNIEAVTLPEALESLRAVVPDGVSCYLFGSAARGEAGRGSDLDLLIAAKKQDDAMAVADRVRVALRRQFPVPADVIALGRRELRSRDYAKLVKKIRKEGRRICGPELEVILA